MQLQLQLLPVYIVYLLYVKWYQPSLFWQSYPLCKCITQVTKLKVLAACYRHLASLQALLSTLLRLQILILKNEDFLYVPCDIYQHQMNVLHDIRCPCLSTESYYRCLSSHCQDCKCRSHQSVHSFLGPLHMSLGTLPCLYLPLQRDHICLISAGTLCGCLGYPEEY